MSATIETDKSEPARILAEMKTDSPMQLRKRQRRWIIGAIIIAGVLMWIGTLLYNAFHYEETDDAYVAGRVHQISPQIDGRVTDVLVNDNQAVKAGDVLLKLDPLEYEIGLQKAQASLKQADAMSAQAVAAIAQAKAQELEAEAKAAQAQAQVRQIGAQLELAEHNQSRNAQLFKTNNGAISKSEFDVTQSALDAARAMDDAAQANAKAVAAGVASAQAARTAAEAQQSSAQALAATRQAEVRDAQRKLDDTVLKAPADGHIGNKNVEVGNRVQAGQTLFAFVEPECWVIANFKETQLPRMRVGQRVEVGIDALPGQKFQGTIDSFAPASGAEFALLPADNATGNFTKIVQRVPVKIVFNADTMRQIADHLRPGLSTIVNVRVR